MTPSLVRTRSTPPSGRETPRRQRFCAPGAFTGKSQASLIGAIMSSEPPPVSSSAPLTPPALDQLVGTCLAKDPDERWQSAGDLTRMLKGISAAGSQVSPAPEIPKPRSSPLSSPRLAWSVAGVAVVGLVTALTLGPVRYFRSASETPAYRTSILLPEDAAVPANVTPAARFALSPDGRRLAFVAQTPGGRPQLWIRQLDTLSARPLPGTDGAAWPFWSPDSRYVGYFVDNRVMKIDTSGGPALPVCELGEAGIGGSWNRDDVIVFGVSRSGIYRVAASGGNPFPITRLEETSAEVEHSNPSFLPDGRHFLFEVRGSKAGDQFASS